MKVNFDTSANQREIAEVRTEIKDSADLKKFDDFLARHNSFDFGVDNQVEAARFSCGGTICCPPTTGPIVLTVEV